MAERLWFLTDGVGLLGVYPSKMDVSREHQRYMDDPDFAYYDFYDINIYELEDYPDEYDLAKEEGLI